MIFTFELNLNYGIPFRFMGLFKRAEKILARPCNYCFFITCNITSNRRQQCGSAFYLYFILSLTSLRVFMNPETFRDE